MEIADWRLRSIAERSGPREGLALAFAGTDCGRLALQLGLLLTGHMALNRPARLEFELPSGVREEAPEAAALPVEILREPGQGATSENGG